MATEIHCSGCKKQIQVPLRLSNAASQTDAVYKHLRTLGWEFTARFIWVCPDCFDASTSPATQVLPGRLHEKDWQQKP